MSETKYELMPIGTIVRSIEQEFRHIGALREQSSSDLDTIVEIAAVYAKFDALCQPRSDYAIWRAFIKPHFSYRRPWLQDIQGAQNVAFGRSLHSILQDGVEESDPIQIWSIIGMMPAIFTGQRGQEDIISKKEILQISNRLLGKVKYEIFPLKNLEASCGASLALLLINMAGYDRASTGRIGLVTLTFRSLNSFRQPFVRRPRGFCRLTTSAAAVDCRTH